MFREGEGFTFIIRGAIRLRIVADLNYWTVHDLKVAIAEHATNRDDLFPGCMDILFRGRSLKCARLLSDYGFGQDIIRGNSDHGECTTTWATVFLKCNFSEQPVLGCCRGLWQYVDQIYIKGLNGTNFQCKSKFGKEHKGHDHLLLYRNTLRHCCQPFLYNNSPDKNEIVVIEILSKTKAIPISLDISTQGIDEIAGEYTVQLEALSNSSETSQTFLSKLSLSHRYLLECMCMVQQLRDLPAGDSLLPLIASYVHHHTSEPIVIATQSFKSQIIKPTSAQGVYTRKIQPRCILKPSFPYLLTPLDTTTFTTYQLRMTASPLLPSSPIHPPLITTFSLKLVFDKNNM